MSDIKGKVKTIIMDKAPAADELRMQQQLGFNGPLYQQFTDLLNATFGTNLTPGEVEAQQTVNDVVTLVENSIPATAV